MHSLRLGRILNTSLVIFAMLFGAGNLIFPLKVGLLSGDKYAWGLAGFILTGVLLPLLGLLAIIAFDGNYNEFFGRVGKIPGRLLIFFCMMAIGPLIVMPRILTLSYEMMRPFLFNLPLTIFALIFLTLVFLATYKPRHLMALIGNILSPLKITSLLIIIFAGLFSGLSPALSNTSALSLFGIGAHYGYGTLDLLATIFFGAIIVKLLSLESGHLGMRQRVKIAGAAGIGAAVLLGLVYIGMGLLGAYHGQGLEALNEGALFSTICFRVLGHYGAALIGFTIFLACFTTTVALTAVVTEYIQTSLLHNKVNYTNVLIGVLAATFIPASLGLSAILKFSMPIIEAMYPVLIVIAICNALYKLFGFRMIKLPVGVTFLYVVIKAILDAGIF